MIVKRVVYASTFVKNIQRLPESIVASAIMKEKQFKLNPFHPSLRLHSLKGKLKGLWSISMSGNYRIIFERKKNGDLLFISIGKHDIYRSL